MEFSISVIGGGIFASTLMPKFGIIPGQKGLKRPLNFNTNSYSHFALVLMPILDPGQWTFTTPVCKVAISFADTKENLGLCINPGP